MFCDLRDEISPDKLVSDDQKDCNDLDDDINNDPVKKYRGKNTKRESQPMHDF